MDEKTVKVNIETEGFDEAMEQIDALVDAFDGYPAQVIIKNCRDCNFYIYPSQNKTIVGGGIRHEIDRCRCTKTKGAESGGNVEWAI